MIIGLFRKYVLISASLLLSTTGCSVSKKSVSRFTDPELVNTINQVFEEAGAQYQLMKKNIPAKRFPRYFDPRENKFETSGGDWWTSGFYTGTLFYLYSELKDPDLLKEAERMLVLLDKQKNNKSTADLGFIMYTSFANAMKVEPRVQYQQALLASAKALASRYNSKVKAIRSWDVDKKDFLVLIDNMMNLDLLFWATFATGDSSYYKIAIEHAETTMAHQFRPDFSSYNMVNYNPETGAVKEYRSTQGYSKESSWARGQAYALYGFTTMYRETHDPRYLEQAEKIASFIVNHPSLPEDMIPYWDFNVPGIPNTFRDAGAGAITASALLELSEYLQGGNAKKFFRSAETMIRSLASPAYTSHYGNNGGFLLKHSSGYVPVRMEMDMSHPYTDYYYIEALRRYKAIAADEH